ncbi:MAG TPA: MgtC/SapB family protein [Burkholderiales bacterium]|jgi:putative Mg2+ transporter-C (MgtC) family protein
MLAHHEIVLRLTAAALLGGAVGLERERLEWVAGLRTHMLVCLSAALVMIVSAYGFADILDGQHVVLDPSRIAAQVVSGIGFLGAGTILFLRHKVIRGLTTAASLWTVAAIGLAVGGGLYLAAAVATALVLVILALVKPLERRLFGRGHGRRLVVHVERGRASLEQIEAAMQVCGLTVEQITLKRSDDPAVDAIDFVLVRNAKKDAVRAVAAHLQAIEGIRTISL